LLRQKKVTKEKAARVRRPAKARGSLRYSKRQAAAELLGRNLLVIDASNVAPSSNSPRGMPLSLLRCSATLTGPSYFWGLSLRLRNWAPACAGAGGFSFCSFVSEFHFDPRCNFLSHAHPFQFILHFTTRRIREFPCCRANILEKGRGFPRKLFEAGAILPP
jgi:hypothetical protein